MNRHDDAQGCIGAFQFLADQSKRNIVKSLTAIPHRDIDSQNAQFAHARQGVGVHLLLAIPFADSRNNLFGAEVAHHFLRLHMLVS
jgi:hypothetical protein